MNNRKAKKVSKLEKTLNQHSDKFETLPNGKIKCKITGHQIMPSEQNVLAHLKSKSYKKGAQSKFDISAYQDVLITHKDNEHFLFCKITGAKIPKKKSAIEKHVNGKKFKSRLEQYRENMAAQEQKQENIEQQEQEQDDQQEIDDEENGEDVEKQEEEEEQEQEDQQQQVQEQEQQAEDEQQQSQEQQQKKDTKNNNKSGKVNPQNHKHPKRPSQNGHKNKHIKKNNQNGSMKQHKNKKKNKKINKNNKNRS